MDPLLVMGLEEEDSSLGILGGPPVVGVAAWSKDACLFRDEVEEAWPDVGVITK